MADFFLLGHTGEKGEKYCGCGQYSIYDMSVKKNERRGAREV